MGPMPSSSRTGCTGAPGYQSSEWEARLERASAYALYLHVPFCAQKCAYCDFASWTTRRDDPLMSSYAAALASQIDEARGLGLLEGLETAYIGGGTPSLLGAESLGAIVRNVASLGPAELSCEANPDSLTDEVLETAREAGATRLSIGVQSLVDSELRKLGRLHDAALAQDRVRAAVALGFDVSCDLMCATPGQSDASWALTLSQALALGAGHVSVYPLMIEEGTAFDRLYSEDSYEWNSDEVQAQRMQKAQVVLEGNGFNRYEVASYTKPGKACKHNEAYWTGQPYLGLGTKASSMLTLKCYTRLRDACRELPPSPSGTARVRLTVLNSKEQIARDPRLSSLRFDIEFLTSAQAAAEDLMLGARLSEGLDPGLVAHARGLLPGTGDCLEGLVRDGYLTKAHGRFVPTEQGWLLGNELYERLWDLAPGEVASLRQSTMGEDR